MVGNNGVVSTSDAVVVIQDLGGFRECKVGFVVTVLAI